MSASAEKKNPERTALSEVTPLTPPDRPPGYMKAQAQALRRARSRRLAKRFALFVVLPTALAALYYGGIASPQFESYSTFIVQSSELHPTLGVDGILATLGTGTAASHDDMAVRDYVLSRDMLRKLDKQQGLIKHYEDGSKDFFSRLGSNASFEEAYEYFGHKVFAEYDQVSGSITIHVRAFSAEKAQAFVSSILANSEEMVNKLSERERRDRTAYAESEVKKAEGRLSAARQAIISLQKKHGDFNPLETAAATMEIRTQLQGELAMARAHLLQLKSYMKSDSPQVMAAAEKVSSLSAQVSGANRQLVAPGDSGGLGSSLADFEAAKVEKEFAQKAYESALTTLELARSDANRQHRYIAMIAAPSTPDESTYPHRARSILAAFVMSFLLLGIGSMVSAAVKEHARL